RKRTSRGEISARSASRQPTTSASRGPQRPTSSTSGDVRPLTLSYRAARNRPAPKGRRRMTGQSEQRHVVIVGGGFAGLGCALRLAKHDEVHVTLIDRNNYHQFQPLLYQVATSQLAPSDIAHSLRAVFAEQDNVDVKMAE